MFGFLVCVWGYAVHTTQRNTHTYIYIYIYYNIQVGFTQTAAASRQLYIAVSYVGYFYAFWTWAGTPRSLRGRPLHILCPEGAFFLRFGCPKVPLGAPLGHSWGSLSVHLCTLWQHMFRMPAFMGARGGIRRPSGLKVAPLHRGLCAITIVKTDVSTTHHFCRKFGPKWCPKGSQGHLLVPFWAHFVSRCRLWGVPRAICGPLWGPLWI